MWRATPCSRPGSVCRIPASRSATSTPLTAFSAHCWYLATMWQGLAARLFVISVSPASLSDLACASQAADSSTDGLPAWRPRLEVFQNLVAGLIREKNLVVRRRTEGTNDFFGQGPIFVRCLAQLFGIGQ